MDSRHFEHIGVARRSGRYPWGSGGALLDSVDRMKSKGLSDVQIAEALGMKTTELRQQKQIAKLEQKESRRLNVIRLKDSGMSVSAISTETGLSGSTIRDLLKPEAGKKFAAIQLIVKVLKAAVDRFKFIDIGEGVEIWLGVSSIKLKQAIRILTNDGYKIHYLSQEQMGTGKFTSVMVLGPPGSTYEDLLKHRQSKPIGIPNHVSEDGKSEIDTMGPVVNITKDRVGVRTSEFGGAQKDGLIEIRPGVADLDLGNKRYAQVRIAVEGGLYLKGMAIYSDKIPPGTDILFNTNKAKTDDPLGSLKKQKVDGINEFGTTVKGKTFVDASGVQQRSALNLVYEEGDWNTWSKNLAGQFLSKQSPKLAQQQLKLAEERRQAEFDSIMALTNPTVKRHLLDAFSDSADSAAVHLKAAALPRQSTKVLLPEPSLKPNEVYAPTYNNGDVVSLIRYPHGGVFEIPTLTVNNKNRALKKNLGAATDAIAIHPDVASIISGADFDGDTVIVAPNANRQIRTKPALAGLANFDPQSAYPYYDGMKVMTPKQKETQMGNISNLITDMTIQGASSSELARAVRHSMVIIDSEKHRLNYRESARQNGVTALKRKYQGSGNAGASTLLSRAKGQQYVPQRRQHFAVDPVTGKKVYTHTDATYINKDGVEIRKMTRSSQMAEESNPINLSSGTVIERVYANHAASMKNMGNEARLASINTKSTPYSRSSYDVYRKEVDSLNAKLTLSMKNQPLERKAQIMAGEMVRVKKQNNPDMSNAQVTKEKGRALVVARIRVGTDKKVIDITPREWEAIQMGAVTPNKLSDILRNSDMDRVRMLATPKTPPPVSKGQVTRATVLLSAGYTIAEVASAVGLSTNQVSTINLT